LQRLQRKRHNPYLVRLSEIFTHAEKTLLPAKATTDTAPETCNTSAANDQLTSDFLTSYFASSTQANTSFTRVSQLYTDFNSVNPKADTNNETSRFENTDDFNSTFNLTKLLANLPRADLTHLYDDEEITSSPIVIHAPSAHTASSSLMSLLLDKIDKALSTYNSSRLFTSSEARDIDARLRNDIQSLKNSEKGLTALSQSMLAGGGKPNPLLAVDRSQNVLADMLTDMVASYLNESHGMTPRTELFDSTKLPDENRVVKKELNTPNVTGIYESTPQIEQSLEERVDKALEVDMPDENLNKKDLAKGNSVRKVCICFSFICLF